MKYKTFESLINGILSQMRSDTSKSKEFEKIFSLDSTIFIETPLIKSIMSAIDAEYPGSFIEINRFFTSEFDDYSSIYDMWVEFEALQLN